MRAFVGLVSTVLLLCGWSLVVATSASAANVPGTIVVGNTGPSTVPYFPGPVGVSSSGLAYEQLDGCCSDVGSWYGLPSGTTAPVALSDLPGGDYPGGDYSGGGALVAGDLAVVTDGVSTMSWETLDGSSGGTAPIVPSGQGFSWDSDDLGISAAPTGWLVFGNPTSGTQTTNLLLVSTTGTVTNLGVTGGDGVVVGGPDGALVFGEFDPCADAVCDPSYVSYSSPGALVALDVPSSADTCSSVLISDVVCSATTERGSTKAVLVPVNGDAPKSLTLPASADAYDVAGTANDAAWVHTDGSISYEPWSTGTVTTVSTGDALPVYYVASDASELVFDGGDTTTTSGVSTLTPPSSTAVTAVVFPPTPVGANTLAIGPGRVAWMDDAPATGLASGATPLWSRSLTNTSGTLSTGSANLISTDAALIDNYASDYGYPPISVSGNRTLYQDTSGDLELLNEDTTSPAVTVAKNSPRVGELSGARVLYESASTGEWKLYDSVTGKSTSLSSISAYSQAAIWGDYVVWMNSDGSIMRMDLSTSPPTIVTVLPAYGGGSTCSPAQLGGPPVMVSGDYVAWGELCGTGDALVTGYSDVASGTVVDLSSTSVPVALSDSYVATTPLTGFSVGDPATLSATNLISSAVTTVGEVSASPGLDGLTITWIDQNGVPEAAPLPAEPDPPRFLGDPSTPTTDTAGIRDWDAEWDTSAALTACTVTITAGATAVNSVPCSTADMAVGEADVAWDGTNSSGATVKSGTYTWSLSASNANGSLESRSGGALSLTGKITVKALKQGGPTSAKVAYGAGYEGNLTVTNATGTVTFTETTSTDSGDVVVTGAGAISATTSLASGTYKVGGGDSDTKGETGSWSFTLTVSR
jgi:hypothetical protein